jgi:hypothetical protein
VNLIHDIVVEGEAVPTCVVPLKRPRVDDLRGSVGTLCLKPRGGIRPLFAVETIDVPRSRRNALGYRGVVTLIQPLQAYQPAIAVAGVAAVGGDPPPS